MHTAVSTALSFAILFGAVGYSFAYVSANPVTIERPEPLGIFGTNVTPTIAELMDLDEVRGFLITEITRGSPAERAGLRGASEIVRVNGESIPIGGDVIIAIDGISIATFVDIQRILDVKDPGDSIRFTVIRNTNTFDVTIPRQAAG